jgi:Spy/CpxP family protein refolding chaperone
MMKRIMTLGATALVLVLMLDASEAQRPGRGSKSRVGGDGAGRLAEALSLTADQQAQLKSLRQQMHEQMESLRQQGTDSAAKPDLSAINTGNRSDRFSHRSSSRHWLS